MTHKKNVDKKRKEKKKEPLACKARNFADQAGLQQKLFFGTLPGQAGNSHQCSCGILADQSLGALVHIYRPEVAGKQPNAAYLQKHRWTRESTSAQQKRHRNTTFKKCVWSSWRTFRVNIFLGIEVKCSSAPLCEVRTMCEVASSGTWVGVPIFCFEMF